MKNRIRSCAMLFAALCLPLAAQDGGGKKAPLTLATALKLGPAGLTKFTNASEAGQDRAAGLYATAKRIETEQALARRDLTLVPDLDSWRETLAQVRGGSCTLAYLVNGGGTMYSHGAARDCAPLEDFLAALATRLPLAEGKGDAKAAKQVDDALAFLRKLKAAEGATARSPEEEKARFAKEVKIIAQQWEALKARLGEIPAGEARRIATFAVESLGWLKQGGE